MKLGMPSLIEFNNVEQHMRLCSELSLDFFEMNFTFPFFQSDKLEVEELKRLKKVYGKGYSFHLHDLMNPFDFSPEVREAYNKMADYALNLALELEVKRMVMHLPYGFYSSIGGIKYHAYDVFSDEYLDRVVAFRSRCEAKLGNSSDGPMICLENTKGYYEYHKKTIDTLLESKCFGLTFDIGHDYKAGNSDEPIILSHEDRLRHFHIHDVTANGNHYALGDGILDIEKYFRMAQDHNCTAVIEVKESQALKRSLEYLRGKNLIK